MDINGRVVSDKFLENIKQEYNELKKIKNRKVGLAVIIVGNNSASKVYVRSKIKKCEELDFYSKVYELEEKVSEEDLCSLITDLNNDTKIDGILVQLPLPKHLDELKIIEQIDHKKDVDGFHPINIGKMFLNDNTGLMSCTPQGIMKLLDYYNVDVQGKDVVIIGKSNIVGKPLANMMINKSATVQVCNSKTKNLKEKIRKSDIIVSAVGKYNFIKKEDIKENAIIIDVGINRVNGKLFGDVDYKDVKEKCSYITPVPGGVGPMTIACLMFNTFKAYKTKSI